MFFRPRLSHASLSGGFTIVELLVVITLILVLIALLLPVLRQAQDAARAVRSSANLMQISVWAFARASDAEGYLPNNYKKPQFGYTEDWHLVASKDLNFSFTDADSLLRDPQLGDLLSRQTSWGVVHQTGIDYGLNAYMGGWDTSASASPWTPVAPPQIEDLTSETFIFSSGGKHPYAWAGGAYVNNAYVEVDGPAPLFKKDMMP